MVTRPPNLLVLLSLSIILVIKFLAVGFSMKNTDDLLNPYYIRDSLPLESKMLVPVIQVYEEVDSTNNVLMEKNCIYPSGHVCFAENQYQGRGMSNKSWISTESNVCFSVAWNYDKALKIPYMLNYHVAIKLVKNLSKNGYGVEISKLENFDIDDMEDWKIAISIFKSLRNDR